MQCGDARGPCDCLIAKFTLDTTDDCESRGWEIDRRGVALEDLDSKTVKAKAQRRVEAPGNRTHKVAELTVDFQVSRKAQPPVSRRSFSMKPPLVAGLIAGSQANTGEPIPAD